jgi:hypothetical protein
MAYKFQLGAYTASGSLVQEGSFRARTINGSTGTIVADSSITAGGDITAGSTDSFIIGGADLNESDCLQLDGITKGTVDANKCLVADASGDVTGTGLFTLGTVKSSVIQDNGLLTQLTASQGLSVKMGSSALKKYFTIRKASGDSQWESFSDWVANRTGYAILQNPADNTDVKQLFKTDTNNRWLIGYDHSDGSSFKMESGATSFTTGQQFKLDTVSGLTLLNALTASAVSSSGGFFGGGNLQIAGSSVKFTGIADIEVVVANDSFYFKDSDGTVKSDSLADYAALIAGDGITATAGVLSVVGLPIPVRVITNSADQSLTASEGLNAWACIPTLNVDLRLPDLDTLELGDSVSVKATNASAKSITILPKAGEKIDEVANKSIVLESDDAAVKFIKISGTNWVLV